MRLTTVFSATNDNPAYYLFIPKQIKFWKYFGINFICIFIGTSLPSELLAYRSNIILWNNTYNLNTAYLAQNIRLFYPALLELPDDELVMITDMDMLPMNDKYYKDGLENFSINDFIYYRHIDANQIIMCYNAAHPKTWSKIFNIKSRYDIDKTLLNNFNSNYDGLPGCKGWCTDQEILYKHLINYSHLKILNRPLKRLETWDYDNLLKSGRMKFIFEYDDGHFHRNYKDNEKYILDAEQQLSNTS